MTPARLAAIEHAHAVNESMTGREIRELIAAVREKDEQIAKLRKALNSSAEMRWHHAELLSATAPEGDGNG